MNFDGLIPVIQCRHIEETLDFYQRAFRYIIIGKTESENSLSWVHIRSDNTQLMLQRAVDVAAESGPKAQLSGNFTLHYYTSDVVAQHQFMTARGFSVGKMQDTPYYIRQFSIVDPEGNTLTVGQEMQPHT
ncbi:MAG TPA: hypothetical protein ENJ08_03915 [Gammaproteobacteria bacterium]|nr:hypothetical protein [Gammaproteobacteria bacterium]